MAKPVVMEQVERDEVTFPNLLAICGESLGALRRKEMTAKESTAIFGGVRATTQVINAEMRMLTLAGRSPAEMLHLLGAPQTPADSEQE